MSIITRMLPQLIVATALGAVPVFTQTTAPAERETLPGAVNYTRVDATVACGGATTPEALTELKQRGFRAVLNLRQASEPEAKVEEEGELVRSLGLTYLHIPLNGSQPTEAPVEEFLTALDDENHRPIYIHCGTANRVAAVWFIKRVLRDGWTIERAMEEARALGLKSPVLEEFALGYVRARVK